MPIHTPAVHEALQLLRRWKANLAGEDEVFAKLDEELDELTEADPHAMLAAIVALLDEGQEMDVVAPLAAGPLEDLLGAYGDKLIGDIERLAQEHPHFRHALGGVWQNDMSDDIWKRVLSAGPDQRW